MDAVPIPDKMQTRRMMGQWAHAVKEPHEYAKFVMSEENPLVWYILLSNFSGNKDEYTGGEYLCRLVAPPEYPYKPPSFYFMTHNGLYQIESKVCISIGEFHPGDHRAALGMSGFSTELVNGMICWEQMGAGIQILNTTAEQKREYAAQSKAYNRQKHPHIIKMIEDSFRSYSAKWDRTKIPAPLLISLGLSEDGAKK